jgi:hypothetical protein
LGAQGGVGNGFRWLRWLVPGAVLVGTSLPRLHACGRPVWDVWGSVVCQSCPETLELFVCAHSGLRAHAKWIVGSLTSSDVYLHILAPTMTGCAHLAAHTHTSDCIPHLPTLHTCNKSRPHTPHLPHLLNVPHFRNPFTTHLAHHSTPTRPAPFRSQTSHTLPFHTHHDDGCVPGLCHCPQLPH